MSGQLHTPATLPPGKEPPVPLDKRLGGPQTRSGLRGEEKILTLPGLELQPLGRPARSYPIVHVSCIFNDAVSIETVQRMMIGWLMNVEQFEESELVGETEVHTAALGLFVFRLLSREMWRRAVGRRLAAFRRNIFSPFTGSKDKLCCLRFTLRMEDTGSSSETLLNFYRITRRNWPSWLKS
jgi:hypothetical protein